MRVRVWLLLSGLALSGLTLTISTAGCGGGSTIRPASDIPRECVLIQPSGEARDSVTVALFDSVEPDIAPWARNPSETLVFGHLYDTLITIDCFGNVRAALAKSWNRDATGRRWKFELRDDVRFWDGSKVTAHDVMRSWNDLAVEPETIGALIDSVDVESDRIFHIYFNRIQTDVPYALSMIEFAVVKSSESSTWPVGSGPYRIVSVQKRSSTHPQRAIIIEPASEKNTPVICFVESRTTDARDLLDGAADVMVTSDHSVLAYAEDHPRMTTAPLEWNRTYVLLSRSRADAFETGAPLRPASPHLSVGLARDAVRTDARPCSPPDWWLDSADCLDPPTPSAVDIAKANSVTRTPSPDRLRILYDLTDPTARDLAERIVALAAAGPDASAETEAVYSALPGLTTPSASAPVTAGVSLDEFALSLRNGDDLAYILSVPRLAPDACTEIRKLIGRAPWLAALGPDLAQAFVPLIDTRPHVILHGSNIGLGVDWYGHVHVLSDQHAGQPE